MAALTSAASDPRVTWRPGTLGLTARILVLGAVAAVALVTPHLIPGQFVNVYSRAMVYGVVALSMNVLIGYVGQVSLGHNAFVGVGAFVSAFLLDKVGLPWVAAAVGAVVLGGVIALGLGAVSLRIKGLYFALVTIAYALFVERTVFGITSLTGGGAGASAPRPAFAQGDIAFAYLALAGLVLAWLFDWRLTASRGGRAIQALRDDERVAASWGINVKGYKLLAFALSGAVAGLAGAMFASIEQIVSPNSFGFGLGLTFVLMTVVGGIRSRPGVVIGGFVFAVLPTLLTEAHDAWGVADASAGTLPPDLIQLALGVGIAALLVHGIVTAFRTGTLVTKLAWLVVGGAAAIALAVVGIGGLAGYLNVWGGLDARIEPIIGAVLLLLTLTQFPGGIAEQFAPVFRWLSFKPFTSESSAAVGGGAAGGGMGARP